MYISILSPLFVKILDINLFRVDHVNAVDNINETVINYLKTAPMVVADMTDHNPNAFYELGFRQALEHLSSQL